MSGFGVLACSEYQLSGVGYKVSGIKSSEYQVSKVVFVFFSPLLWWVLVTTKLEGDLKVIGAKVVEVLHSPTH